MPEPIHVLAKRLADADNLVGDAAFIAASRTLVPQLADLLERCVPLLEWVASQHIYTLQGSTQIHSEPDEAPIARALLREINGESDA